MQMSTEKAETKLTLNDPISQEVLKKMAQITAARSQLGDQLLDLEHERVKILVSSRQLDEEKQRLFAKELSDRGLGHNTPVEVDAKTGQISIVSEGTPPTQ